MQDQGKTKVTYRLPVKLAEAVKELADTNRRPVSTQVELLLESAVQQANAA